ncbi:ribonuclease III [Deltaproteobacteria bacterium TL4]
MFEILCQKLQYQFTNGSLLQQALTHKSHSHDKQLNNERLEFLGDAVLDLVISELLMKNFPRVSEGDLSKIRASLVNEAGLNKIAQSIDLGTFLLMGKGEELTGGRSKSSLLADAIEAIIAAIYIDSRDQKGLDSVRQVITLLFQSEIPKNLDDFSVRDYKTELQEYVQKHYRSLATYELLYECGPDHQKEFEMAVMIDGKEYGKGRGMSKKQAEQVAAQQAIERLSQERSLSHTP